MAEEADDRYDVNDCLLSLMVSITGSDQAQIRMSICRDGLLPPVRGQTAVRPPSAAITAPVT